MNEKQWELVGIIGCALAMIAILCIIIRKAYSENQGPW